MTKYRFAILIAISLLWIGNALGEEFVNAAKFSNSGLRGFVIGSTKWPTRSIVDFIALKNYRVNLLRYFVIFKRNKCCMEYEVDAQSYRNLDETLSRASINGMHVVLTVSTEEDERGILWDDQRLQESFIATWKSLANRYQGNITVAGYDLLNEPVPPGATYAIRASIWRAFASRLARSIRVVDPNHAIIVETAPNAIPTEFKNLKPIELDNVVYSFHFYLPMSLTHQNVLPDYIDKIEYPNLSLDKKSLSRSLDEVRIFARKYSVPILVGEFSCVRWAPNGSAPKYVADAISLFEAEGWSWTYHEFRGWPGWDAEIANDDPHNLRSPNAPTISIIKRALLATPKNAMPN